jgi:hypothetical protein
MAPTTNTQQDDPAAHKGAVEGEKATDKQAGNAQGTGIDKNGLPNNPKATAEDANGANADQTQG